MPPRPPISPEKRKERYLEAVRDKMAKLDAYGEAKPPAREQLWHEITGFLEAGKVLSNITSEELQTIIDEEHLKAVRRQTLWNHLTLFLSDTFLPVTYPV